VRAEAGVCVIAARNLAVKFREWKRLCKQAEQHSGGWGWTGVTELNTPFSHLNSFNRLGSVWHAESRRHNHRCALVGGAVAVASHLHHHRERATLLWLGGRWATLSTRTRGMRASLPAFGVARAFADGRHVGVVDHCADSLLLFCVVLKIAAAANAITGPPSPPTHSQPRVRKGSGSTMQCGGGGGGDGGKQGSRPGTSVCRHHAKM
jgi:hypothetical protein